MVESEKTMLTEDEILNKFGVFYQMEIMQKAAKSCQGKRGKEFKGCLYPKIREIQQEHSPYDFYRELKENEIYR